MDQFKLLTVFPSMLQRTRVADHEDVSKRLWPEIDTIRANTPNGPAGAWACPVFSTLMTDASLHRRDAFSEVAMMFHEEVLVMAQRKSVDLDAQEFFIDRCWLNVLSRGNSMDVHHNPNSFFTGIYFLQAPPDGTRLFLHKEERGVSLPVTKETTLNQGGHMHQPMPGELLIFESYIPYSFLVHESDQEHINLSFTAVGPLSPEAFPS